MRFHLPLPGRRLPKKKAPIMVDRGFMHAGKDFLYAEGT